MSTARRPGVLDDTPRDYEKPPRTPAQPPKEGGPDKQDAPPPLKREPQ